MRTLKNIVVAIFAATCFLSITGAVMAQPAPADTTAPVVTWPREIQLTNAAVLIYQPQIEKWDGDQMNFRAAVAIKPADARQETFGAIFVTARTLVDRDARTVLFDNITITKSNFPTLSDGGAAYIADLNARFAVKAPTISLDRVEASLAANGVKPVSVTVRNEPPRIIISYSPAILVPIDGAPVIKSIPDERRFKRVINTQALILKGGLGDDFYLHVFDGWMKAGSLDGPWEQASFTPFGIDDVKQRLAKSGDVDLLDGGPNANPKPSLANGVPTIYTTQVPAELILFQGQPDFAPVEGTQLLWALNSSMYVIVDASNNLYYALLSGRWFRAPGLNGPWSFVASDALPADFARIPNESHAGVVLASVAGTPQAQEAVIANSIPQTATVPRTNGPAFTPTFDGAPQFSAIAGTALAYTPNSSVPIIRVNSNSYYAVSNGIWFSSGTVTGPWVVATSVPDVIYTIPPSSPVYYVTYVHVYGVTPTDVYVGYTPGYLGTVVSPSGTVVYGTGYDYTTWVGNEWYPPPVTYTVAAAPIYNPAIGYTYGFAMGYAAGAYYHPYAYGGTASANVYGKYGDTAYSATRTAYAYPGGGAGVKTTGTYQNQATGASGSFQGSRSYNPATNTAQESINRNYSTAAGTSGSVSREQSYNTQTGQRSYESSNSATGAQGSSVDRNASATAGPQGASRSSQTTTYNAKTGNTKTWSSGTGSNSVYADDKGNVYKNSGSGWQQHTSSGWKNASGDTSSMNKEAQARSTGESRESSDANFAGGRSGGNGFSGGGFGGRDSGGGGFGGDRFGGGGFGGGGFGGGRGRR